MAHPLAASSSWWPQGVGPTLRLEPLECRALLTTITVGGIGDTIANDGVVTLREAITAANTNAASGDARLATSAWTRSPSTSPARAHTRSL